VLNSTMPIMTVILANFLVDERLTTDRAIGITIGFFGTLIVLIPNMSGGTTTSVTDSITVLTNEKKLAHPLR
jgi:drug/metabolite transporter (DMT)-like permease